MPEREASYYERLAGGQVRCGLCPHQCTLSQGQRGRCLTRQAVEGRLIADNYGLVTALALDPIEKKPLARFHPGQQILSAGSYGCNFSCDFCQNHEIAQRQAPGRRMTAEALIARAVDLTAQGNIGLAYTYNEPLTWYEFVYDCAVGIRQAGLKNVLVSNGFCQPEPFAALLPYLDAVNIDLKSFSGDFYQQYCHGGIETVKSNIQTAAQASWCHVEITTLVIPGRNDSQAEISALAQWLAAIDQEIPLHLTRFFPRNRVTALPPTDKAALFGLADTARQWLKYVYVGNV